MPPQIKQDLNRSGWETTDFPSACESCLPDNPYVQMLKEDHGAECKLCTRPFTIFSWKPDRTSRSKRTNICLTCARLKNCCQSCMLDLSFGLPIVVRDAALKMVAPGPGSDINREYYAQNHERDIEEGRGGVEAYEKTDEKARELLRRLAASEPYHKKQRRLEASGETEDASSEPTAQKQIGYGGYGGKDGSTSTGNSSMSTYTSGNGPVRTRGAPGTRGRGAPRGRGRGGGMGGHSTAPITQAEIQPPADPNITSLFVTGVEDDLPEHAIRTFFSPFGQIRSLICSHRAHCAFVNYADRAGAENAAAQCQGKAVVAGVPLRVAWGKPKPLDSMEREERIGNARAGRAVNGPRTGDKRAITQAGESDGQKAERKAYAVAPPPGQGEVKYASMSGD